MVSGANGRLDRAVVIGRGSIGLRHAKVLEGLGLSVAFVSRRAALDDRSCFPTAAAAINAFAPGYVVIATETAHHDADLDAVLASGFSGPILVEKPLFSRKPARDMLSRPGIYVAYQLRFHPAVLAARDFVANQRCLSAQFYVGQHLDKWRADRSGRETYSGRLTSGGGALRDLSHELDLALWLFGSCLSLGAIGGRFGSVTEDADDAWSIAAAFERCPCVGLMMNMLDHLGQRRIVIVGETDTLLADLVTGTVTTRGRTVSVGTDRNGPISAMHRAVLDGPAPDVADAQAGLATVALIAEVEAAAARAARVLR